MLDSVDRSTVGVLVLAGVCGAGFALLLAVQLPGERGRRSALLQTVGLPMAALAAFLLVISREVRDPGWQALLVNLSATAIGVLFTVFYLENVLRWHEQDLWARSETMILREFVRQSSNILTFLAGLHPGAPPPGDIANLDEETGELVLNEEFLRFARGTVHGAMVELLSRLNDDNWVLVGRSLAQFRADLDRFMGLYRDRVSPEVVTSILRMDLYIAGALSHLNLRAVVPETAIRGVAVNLQMLITDCSSLVQEYWDWEL
jgi:hypothetical protein